MIRKSSNYAVLTTAACLLGCKSSPYEEDRLTQLFSENKEVFRDIVDLVNREEQPRICSGLNSAALSFKSNGRNEFDDSDSAKNLRRKIDSIGVDCVERLVNGGTRFSPRYQPEDERFSYIIRITYKGGTTSVKNCTVVSRPEDDDHCIVALDSNWRIEYRWYELSPD